MNAVAKNNVMDWSKYTLDEWLSQYGAFISINRMRGGHEPDDLGINQIYWLVQQNATKPARNNKTIILNMTDFEYEQLQRLLRQIRCSISICQSAKAAVELYIQKQVRGLTLDQMDSEFKLSRSSINNMITAGRWYLAGHDKRLVI